MPKAQPLPLRSFAPDLDVITPGVLVDGSGFYPTPKGGVRTLPALRLVSQVLPEAAIGGAVVTFPDGQQYMIVGTATTLNAISTTNLTTVPTQPWTTQDYGPSTPTATRWRFAFYAGWPAVGNFPVVIAVDGVRPPQYATQASLNTASPWEPVPDSPPIASLVASSDFSLFFVGETAPIGNETPVGASNKWWSSANASVWASGTVATDTVSDRLDQTPGAITCAKALRSQMVLYKTQSMFIGRLVGPPFVWGFEEVSRQVGAVNQESVVAVDDVHYFLGPDDWYKFDGFNLQRLPNQHRDWFFERVSPAVLPYVIGRYDQARGLIFWHFGTQALTAGLYQPTEYVCLNVRTGTWTNGYLTIESSPASISPDTVTTLEFGTTNALILTDNVVYVYDRTGVGATPGSYVTSSAQGDRYSMFQLTRVRPGITSIASGSTPRLTPLNAYNPGAPFVPGTPVDLSADGWFNMNNTARLQELRFEADDDLEINEFQPVIAPVGDV